MTLRGMDGVAWVRDSGLRGSTDARDWQIAFLSLFLMLGLGTRAWVLSPVVIGVAIATSLLTQFADQQLYHFTHNRAQLWTKLQVQQELGLKDLQFDGSFNWRSPMITALGLCLLLRVDSLGTMAIAATAAISSKFLFRWSLPNLTFSNSSSGSHSSSSSKHFFNPANFGIITARLLCPDARISPGQWGEEFWYGALFLALGGLVLKRVGRWDTTVAFLGLYTGLEAGRNLWLGWSGDVLLHRLSSGSLLLFALFMVTDPRSIPNASGARVAWAGAIALVTFILRNFYFNADAVFWALFALAPLTPLLDHLWPGEGFAWHQSAPCTSTVEV